MVVRPETDESPAWFDCLECPDGGRSYRTDVGADPLNPPLRHLAMIARHLDAEHGITDPTGRIYRGTANDHVVCGYVSATPTRPAWFDCDLCAPGRTRHFLDEPPYGDARATWHLRLQYPELAREIARLSPAEQAVQWEARHRGIQARATQPMIEQAVQDARPRPPRPELTPTQRAIGALLESRVASGVPVTTAIRDLAALADTEPVAYAVMVAEQIPELAGALDQAPDVVADDLVAFYGPPARTQRAMWDIWKRLREEAGDGLEEPSAEDT